MATKRRRSTSSSPFASPIIFVAAIIGVVVTAFMASLDSKNGTRNSDATELPPYAFVILLIFGGLLTAAVVGYVIFSIRRSISRDRMIREMEERESKALESAVDQLRQKMSLPSLIELNRLMLDSYHSIATNQAEKSFRSSQRAMLGGFAWLIACFSVGFIYPQKNAGILIGSIAVTGGALAAFLGRTYLHVYDRSLQQLNQYFDQPLLNSYYLTAERLVSEMSDDGRDALLAKIVERLLEGTGELSIGRDDRHPVKRGPVRQRAGQGSAQVPEGSSSS